MQLWFLLEGRIIHQRNWGKEKEENREDHFVHSSSSFLSISNVVRLDLMSLNFNHLLFIWLANWQLFRLSFTQRISLSVLKLCGFKARRLFIVMCTEGYQQGWTEQFHGANWGRARIVFYRTGQGIHPCLQFWDVFFACDHFANFATLLLSKYIYQIFSLWSCVPTLRLFHCRGKIYGLVAGPYFVSRANGPDGMCPNSDTKIQKIIGL